MELVKVLCTHTDLGAFEKGQMYYAYYDKQDLCQPFGILCYDNKTEIIPASVGWTELPDDIYFGDSRYLVWWNPVNECTFKLIDENLVLTINEVLDKSNIGKQYFIDGLVYNKYKVVARGTLDVVGTQLIHVVTLAPIEEDFHLDAILKMKFIEYDSEQND